MSINSGLAAVTGQSPTDPVTTPTIYTPPNWATQKALYSISFNTQGAPAQQIGVDPEGTPIYSTTTSTTANGYNPATGLTMFVFDAIKRASHKVFAVATQHPLQTGYNISDHVIMQPVRLILEVAMNDSIASYSNGPGLSMWGSNASKSVAAFQQMKSLMVNRQLLTVNTRLDTYSNMVLVDIDTEDTRKTYFGGLLMVLSFQQLFIANVAIQTDSARAETTGLTDLGAVQPTVPDAATVAQHQVTQESYDALMQRVVSSGGLQGTQTLPSVPGAGVFSSTLDWFNIVTAFRTP